MPAISEQETKAGSGHQHPAREGWTERTPLDQWASRGIMQLGDITSGPHKRAFTLTPLAFGAATW